MQKKKQLNFFWPKKNLKFLSILNSKLHTKFYFIKIPNNILDRSNKRREELKRMRRSTIYTSFFVSFMHANALFILPKLPRFTFCTIYLPNHAPIHFLLLSLVPCRPFCYRICCCMYHCPYHWKSDLVLTVKGKKLHGII